MGETADSLIDDIAITRTKDGGHLDINFTGPVRYLGCFPINQGDVIQVKLRAISFRGFEDNYSITNKLVVTGKASDYSIEDIRYEGNVPGGPFIVLRFTEAMKFEIGEGSGLKSLLISYKKI